jgi:hypothetical protein
VRYFRTNVTQDVIAEFLFVDSADHNRAHPDRPD